jgi:hypothetical protein
LFNDITDWKEKLDLATINRVFALFGCAGTGKTTVSREVCDRLQAENRLGASFFFRSGAGDLGSTGKVIPTIAFQLANLQYPFRPHVASAAREYMKSPSGSLEVQLNSLIMEPVEKARSKNAWLAEVPIIIVLDALDEAGKDIGNLLKQLKRLVDAQYNFWIFVTTRPESSITYALFKSGMNTAMMRVNMEDVSQKEVDNDIRRFLQDRFASLRWRKELLAMHANAINTITEKAERLFIYARTVMEYLDHKIPEVSVQRLDAILHDSAGKVGLPALDALYATVLQNAYDQEAIENDVVRARVTALLAGLVAFQGQSPCTSNGSGGGCSHQDRGRDSLDFVCCG